MQGFGYRVPRRNKQIASKENQSLRDALGIFKYNETRIDAMAVQKTRKSPSKRGTRRAHDALKAPALSIDPTSGETHRRHHISPDGYYRGRKIVASREEEQK